MKGQARLDHVVYAAADLNAASRAFAAATGCEPVPGGPHPGLGTHNAIVSFEGGAYLEIIAPDPAQPAADNLAARLSRLEAPTLFHWAIRVDDLGAVGASLRAAGLQPTPPIPTRRTTPSGQTLAWDLMMLPGMGGAWPFFIDWKDSPHPSSSAPVVGSICGFRANVEGAIGIAALLDQTRGLPSECEVRPAMDGLSSKPGLALTFESPRGRIAWEAAHPPGFVG